MSGKPTPYQQACALVPLRLAAAAGLLVCGFERLADLGPRGSGIEAQRILDRDGERVDQAAVVWSYDGQAVEVWWSLGKGRPIERRRFALAVSDAGELTIVNLDVLGMAETVGT